MARFTTWLGSLVPFGSIAQARHQLRFTLCLHFMLRFTTQHVSYGRRQPVDKQERFDTFLLSK